MLVRGDKLGQNVRREVLSAFVRRWTFENAGAENVIRNRATCTDPIPLVSDADWLADHAFHVTQDGSRLMRNRRYAEPALLAVSR
jgi:hypothetical protein